jgi:AraC-like DNA-binding protein
MNYRVWSKLIQGIVGAAEKVGLDANDLLSKVNLEPSILYQSDVRVSHQQLCSLWVEILKQSGEESIGLKLAISAQPGTYDVVHYALECSADLEEALTKLGRYIRLIHEASVVILKTEGSVAKLTHAVVGVSPPLPPVAYQWVMANIVGAIRRMTELEFIPFQVSFQHPQPANISVYYEFFQTTVKFFQPSNELCFDAKFLQQPLVKSNSGLFTVLDRYATELLAKLPQTNCIINQVKREIHLHLRSGAFQLDTVAQTLQISPRTLQRQLKELGTSYQVLLDEVRHEIAISYLQEQRVSASDLALLLGFSETSAFHRAFKRWTQKTLSEFRKTTNLNL